MSMVAGKGKAAWAAAGCVAAALVLPLVCGESRYYMNVLNLAGIFTILTYSLNLIHGYLGLISIGQAGFFALGAYISTGLNMGLHLGYIPSLVAGGMAAAAAGVLIGFPAARVGGHYFVLVSLGFGEIVRLIILNWKQVTHGTNGINGIPSPTIGPWVFASRFSFYYLILCFVVLAVLATRSLRRSKYGRSMLALKSAELAACVMGVNPLTNKVINLAMAGFLAGTAGGLYASYIGSISPEVFSVDLSVDVLTMTVVGGSGTLAGPIIGAVFLVLLKEWLRFLREFYMILYGAGIVLVMIFMPYGIVGLARRALNRGGIPSFKSQI